MQHLAHSVDTAENEPLKSLLKISQNVLNTLRQVRRKKYIGQTPDTLSGVCETLKLYKPYGVTFSKIGFWDGPLPLAPGLQQSPAAERRLSRAGFRRAKTAAPKVNVSSWFLIPLLEGSFSAVFKPTLKLSARLRCPRLEKVRGLIRSYFFSIL